MGNAVCKACGATIKWIKTKKGKFMPCDLPAVSYQMNYKGADNIVTEAGKVIRADIIKENDLNPLTKVVDGKGYISHYSTCPFADRFRWR